MYSTAQMRVALWFILWASNCGPIRGCTGTVVRLRNSLFDLRISGKVRTGLDLTLQGRQEQPSTYFETPGAQQRPRIFSQLVKNSHRLLTLKLSFLFRSYHALPNANGNEIRIICNYVCTVIQSPPSYIKMLQYYNTTQTDVDTEEGEALGTSCCSEWQECPPITHLDLRA